MKCVNKTKFTSFLDERPITNFPNRDYDIENCLISLEEWILSLFEKVESCGNVSKLRYCYWCVNTVRIGLNKCGLLEHEEVRSKVITMSEHFRNVMIDCGFVEFNLTSIPAIQCTSGRHILSPICRKSRSNKRKIRRKGRSHKQSKDSANINKPFSSSKEYQLDLQFLIDELYLRARAVIAENYFDEVHVLKELGKTISTKNEMELQPVLDTDQLSDNCRKYQTQLWSGDCKINGDSRDSFSDTFDNFLESSNSDIDLGTLKERLFQRFKRSSIGSHRSGLKKDSDFDEGFSENEFIDDIGGSFLFNKTSEPARKQFLDYCGDCDYNSSNSKLYEGSPDRELTQSDDKGVLDEGSDSDGGTEILNSVNATVNKFNAIMQNTETDSVGGQADQKGTSVFVHDGDYADNQWAPVDHIRVLKTQAESGDRNATDSPLAPLAYVPSSFREDRVDSPPTSSLTQVQCPVYQPSQHISSLPNMSSVNGEPMSKMMLSPISIQNWCSFNCNYLPTRSFNYYSKNMKSYESTASSIENYEMQKLNPWLPCISSAVSGVNGYHLAVNHRQQQQQLHQILLSPQLTLPPMNLSSMQHNIVHLPQIFPHSPHSVFDSDYLDRRYTQINPKLYSPSNHHNNSGSEPLGGPPPLSVVTNTNNHSNMAAPKSHLCQTMFKSSLDKSQRACCFYMRGGCKKEDCEYAHDLSKVTCKFWEKGDCFKSDTCPFKHGYHKH